MSVCVRGKYQKRYAADSNEPNITYRFTTANHKRFESPVAMRFVIWTDTSLAEIRYRSSHQSSSTTVERGIFQISDGQIINWCCNFYLFNSTFTVIVDDHYFGKIDYPVADNDTSESFELHWANRFEVKRGIQMDTVNMTFRMVEETS